MSDRSDILGENARAACARFEAELPAHLEGEQRPDVPAHARECHYCAAVLGDLERIQAETLRLQGEDPPVRVWANIRAGLASEARLREPVSGWRRWLPLPNVFAQPVPAGALALLTVISLTFLIHPEKFGRRESTGGAPENATVVAAGIAGLDNNLVSTLLDMENNYREREGTLQSSAHLTYRKTLETVNASIRECLNHCQREPGNRLAREYLVNAYKMKAELLSSALELAGR